MVVPFVRLCAAVAASAFLAACGGLSDVPNASTTPTPSGMLSLFANSSSTALMTTVNAPFTLTLAQTVTITVAESGYFGTFSAATTAGAPCFVATAIASNQFLVTGDALATCAGGPGSITFVDAQGHSAVLYLSAV